MKAAAAAEPEIMDLTLTEKQPDHQGGLLSKNALQSGLGPGIWRKYRAKNAVSLAFALLDQKPT